MRTTHKPLILLILLAGVIALLATGCGVASPENLFESAANAAGADIDDLEFDEETGGFSASVGGAEVAFGTLAERPDWLEDNIQLPDGLAIQIAINDPSTGERAVQGFIDGGNAEQIAADQAAALTAAGYERLGDSTVFVGHDQRPFELRVEDAGTGAYYLLESRGETEQELRDFYAPIEANGSMAISLGGDNLVFEGPCTLRSSSGSFETSFGESGAALAEQSGSAVVELRDTGDHYFLADVQTADGNWTLMQVDADNNPPQVSVDERGFTIDGSMMNWWDNTTVDVRIGVSCPAS